MPGLRYRITNRPGRAVATRAGRRLIEPVLLAPASDLSGSPVPAGRCTLTGTGALVSRHRILTAVAHP